MLALAPSVTPSPVEPPPSADLLLYLGEFEDAGGDFVDPMSIDTAAAPTPEATPVATRPPKGDDHDDAAHDDDPAT